MNKGLYWGVEIPLHKTKIFMEEYNSYAQLSIVRVDNKVFIRAHLPKQKNGD